MTHIGVFTRTASGFAGRLRTLALDAELTVVRAENANAAPLVMDTGARWMVWVKGFAAFKRNVPVAYAWEPVIIKAARRPVVSRRQVMRDWIQESITLRRGLTGAKPEAVCHWAFELLGARPDDVLDDLYPGTGAVTRAWESWRRKFVLPQLSLSPPKRHPDDPPLDMLMPEDL